MKKIHAVLSTVLFFLAASIFNPAAADTVDLTILHLNDFHGHLMPAPGRNGKPGTAAWLKRKDGLGGAGEKPAGDTSAVPQGHVPGYPRFRSLPGKARH